LSVAHVALALMADQFLFVLSPLIVTRLPTQAVAAIEAFDVSTPLSVAHAAFAFVLAPLISGVLFGDRRVGAYIGTAAFAVSYGLLLHARAPVVPTEWSGLVVIFVTVAQVSYLLLAIVLVPLGSMLGRRLRERLEHAPHTRRLPMQAGFVGALVMAVSWAVLLAIPDEQSFEMRLPDEWKPFSAPIRRSWDPAYGDQFLAALGSTERPSYRDPPRVPVVGVSVAPGFNATADDCSRIFNVWGAPPSTLHDSELVDWEETTLPVGPAFEMVRAPEGLVHYSYSVVRERWAGVFPRTLCYVIVVTIPAGSLMDAMDARALAEEFRFR
jgi:hypothetical protein